MAINAPKRNICSSSIQQVNRIWFADGRYKLQNNKKIIIIMTTMNIVFFALSPMQWILDTGYTVIGQPCSMLITNEPKNIHFSMELHIPSGFNITNNEQYKHNTNAALLIALMLYRYSQPAIQTLVNTGQNDDDDCGSIFKQNKNK